MSDTPLMPTPALPSPSSHHGPRVGVISAFGTHSLSVMLATGNLMAPYKVIQPMWTSLRWGHPQTLPFRLQTLTILTLFLPPHSSASSMVGPLVGVALMSSH